MPTYRLIKTKAFPNVHVLENSFILSADDTLKATKSTTIYPVIMQDEGLGDPNSKYTNPESASFSESAEANCYPDSRVNYCRVNAEFGLTKDCYATDNIEVVKIMVVPIMMSFLENYTALNDVTSEEVEDLLEMQHETTDRQGYPLWTGTKLSGDKLSLGTNPPGLTTNTNIESVNFDINKLYDGLQFYKNGKKLKGSIGRVRWLNISKRRNLRVSFRMKSKSKAMNPYTFFGILIHVPSAGDVNQMFTATDTTAINHIRCKLLTRYNEWNENFNFMR